MIACGLSSYRKRLDHFSEEFKPYYSTTTSYVTESFISILYFVVRSRYQQVLSNLSSIERQTYPICAWLWIMAAWETSLLILNLKSSIDSDIINNTSQVNILSDSIQKEAGRWAIPTWWSKRPSRLFILRPITSNENYEINRKMNLMP